MKEPVYFLKLELENVRCFGEKAILDLSDGNGNWKKWTVILGDNGTGKTTLLQIIAEFESRKLQFINPNSSITPLNEYRLINDAVSGRYSLKSKLKSSESVSIKVDFLNGGIFEDFHFELFQFKVGKSSHSISHLLPLFGYGANRIMDSNSSSLQGGSISNCETLFNNEGKLINAEEWLLDLDYTASKDSPVKDFAINRKKQVEQILIDLLPDISGIRFSVPTKENLKPFVEFETTFGWVTIHELSLGYKTMVSWMVDLAAKMFESYPDNNYPLSEPSIVLVDEIDLHLHPKWQRKIFDYLSDKFPQTQFVVTAHSPLVVQSAPKDANIVVLRKEGDHVVIDNDIKSVQDWRLDQIMSSDLFGIDSSRGPETEKWLNERKELLQKESLTPQEKERLAELNKRAHDLPTADNAADIESMDIIRKAADYLKNHKA